MNTDILRSPAAFGKPAAVFSMKLQFVEGDFFVYSEPHFKPAGGGLSGY
jgi:hypothetical protein